MSCVEREMTKTISEQQDSIFYFTKNTFDGVQLLNQDDLESVFVFIKDRPEIVRTIDKRDRVVDTVGREYMESSTPESC